MSGPPSTQQPSQEEGRRRSPFVSADVPAPFADIGPDGSREEFAAAIAIFLRPHRRRYELLLGSLGEEEMLLFSVLASGCRASLASAYFLPGSPDESSTLAAMLDAYLLNLHLLVDYPAEDFCKLPWYSFLNIFATQPSRASVLPLAMLRVPRTARTVLTGRYPETQSAIFELFNADLGAAGQFHRFYNNFIAFAAASFAVLCGSGGLGAAREADPSPSLPPGSGSAPLGLGAHTTTAPTDQAAPVALPAMEAFLAYMLSDEASATAQG